jgi:hypothetical protein
MALDCLTRSMEKHLPLSPIPSGFVKPTEHRLE